MGMIKYKNMVVKYRCTDGNLGRQNGQKIGGRLGEVDILNIYFLPYLAGYGMLSELWSEIIIFEKNAYQIILCPKMPRFKRCFP